MKDKFIVALKSRTTWTIVILFLINGVSGIRELLPGNWLPIVDAVLSLAAVYFRVNRKADK